MEGREVGGFDVEAHNVDLDTEEGDFPDAETEECVFGVGSDGFRT